MDITWRATMERVRQAPLMLEVVRQAAPMSTCMRLVSWRSVPLLHGLKDGILNE